MKGQGQKTIKGGIIMRHKKTNTFTYYFEELELIKGYAVTATGEEDIEYRIAPAEPDVGIFDPWATDIDITSIVVHSNKNNPSLNLSQDHWLYKLIYDALINSDHVQQSCEEDACYEADI
jgi:hypothetical protein